MRTYTIVVEAEETGSFSVFVPALPGCFSQGETLEECMTHAQEAISLHIEGLTRDGLEVPEERMPPRLLTVTA